MAPKQLFLIVTLLKCGFRQVDSFLPPLPPGHTAITASPLRSVYKKESVCALSNPSGQNFIEGCLQHTRKRFAQELDKNRDWKVDLIRAHAFVVMTFLCWSLMDAPAAAKGSHSGGSHSSGSHSSRSSGRSSSSRSRSSSSSTKSSRVSASRRSTTSKSKYTSVSSSSISAETKAGGTSKSSPLSSRKRASTTGRTFMTTPKSSSARLRTSGKANKAEIASSSQSIQKVDLPGQQNSRSPSPTKTKVSPPVILDTSSKASSKASTKSIATSPSPTSNPGSSSKKSRPTTVGSVNKDPASSSEGIAPLTTNEKVPRSSGKSSSKPIATPASPTINPGSSSKKNTSKSVGDVNKGPTSSSEGKNSLTTNEKVPRSPGKGSSKPMATHASPTINPGSSPKKNISKPVGDVNKGATSSSEGKKALTTNEKVPSTRSESSKKGSLERSSKDAIIINSGGDKSLSTKGKTPPSTRSLKDSNSNDSSASTPQKRTGGRQVGQQTRSSRQKSTSSNVDLEEYQEYQVGSPQTTTNKIIERNMGIIDAPRTVIYGSSPNYSVYFPPRQLGASYYYNDYGPPLPPNEPYPPYRRLVSSKDLPSNAKLPSSACTAYLPTDNEPIDVLIDAKKGVYVQGIVTAVDRTNCDFAVSYLPSNGGIPVTKFFNTPAFVNNAPYR